MAPHYDSEAVDLEGLAEEIAVKAGRPVDYLQVAATLEVMGYTDSVIRDRYGYPNSFSLGRRLLNDCLLKADVAYAGSERRYNVPAWPQALSSFIRGALMLLPVTLSLIILILGEVLIRNGAAPSSTQINALALALVVSMIVSGGFGKALTARLMESYSIDNTRLNVGISAGLTTAAIVLTFIVSLALLKAIPSSLDPLFFLAATTGLAVSWMGLFMLFSVRKEWLFAPIYAGALAIAATVGNLFSFDYPHMYFLMIGILASVVMISAFTLIGRSRSNEKKQEEDVSGSPLCGISMGQFAFGFLFFSTLFADRLANWMGNGGFVFSPSYETSMDIAMFSLLLGAGLLEYRITIFWRDLVNCRRNYRDKASVLLSSFFIKSAGQYIAASLLGICISVMIVTMTDIGGDVRVVFVASCAYPLLAWGSFACSIYMGFRRWAAAVLIGLVALAVNLIIGFWLSRAVDPDIASVGLLAGSIVFFTAGSALLFYVCRDYAYLRYSSN